MKTPMLQNRLKTYIYIVCALLVVLGLRLAVVQIFYSEKYQTKASENRIRLLPILASRGEIYDRNGATLAANEPVYTLSLSYLEGNDQDKIIARLAELLQPYYPEVTTDQIQEKIELQKYRLFEPVAVMRDIPWELVVQIEENRQELPGVAVNIEPLRVYPQETMAGHVLGYIHAINEEELARSGDKYSINSLIGKSGVEKVYESQLKGKDGARRVEVDAQGRPMGELVTMSPVPGQNLTLTLDLKLQKVLEASMASNLQRIQQAHPKAKVGAAVLMDVKTGEILAMTSHPLMRPDDFKGKLASSLVPYYFPAGDKYNPMEPGAAINRAIQAQYPPGSTFKPITGMAALESGKLDPFNDLINCAGRYWIAPYIPCTGVHGNENYFNGMADSCNTYFQEAGRRAGKDKIIEVAKDFGLGEKTGIDLSGEVSGLVPTPAWKKEINAILIDRKYDNLRKQLQEKYDRLLAEASSEQEREVLQKQQKNESAKLEAQYTIDYNFDTKWQAFDTFNMSIGQGSNQYTVMQLANYAATIANGGYLMEPHLVKKITDPNNGQTKEIKPKIIHKTSVSANTLALTRQAMQSVTKPGGTASFLFTSFPENIPVAAKTGTAQTGRVGDKTLSEFHGVFIAFAPADNPQIAFAGVVEYGQHGSESAGWVAKDMFEQYFGLVDHYAAIMAKEEQARTEVQKQTDPVAETSVNGSEIDNTTSRE
ncbi:MAG: penicillin-binding protein 2 [Syntrophomonadaceae bacterium]|nr:penicillin-binding protein 2 [Syntrophomonadaceae bacterium]